MPRQDASLSFFYVGSNANLTEARSDSVRLSVVSAATGSRKRSRTAHF